MLVDCQAVPPDERKAPASELDEGEADDEVDWHEHRQGVLVDVLEERGAGRAARHADALDHHVRAVANVCAGTKEDRAQRDGDEVGLEAWIAGHGHHVSVALDIKTLETHGGGKEVDVRRGVVKDGRKRTGAPIEGESGLETDLRGVVGQDIEWWGHGREDAEEEEGNLLEGGVRHLVGGNGLLVGEQHAEQGGRNHGARENKRHGKRCGLLRRPAEVVAHVDCPRGAAEACDGAGLLQQHEHDDDGQPEEVVDACNVHVFEIDAVVDDREERPAQDDVEIMQQALVGRNGDGAITHVLLTGGARLDEADFFALLSRGLGGALGDLMRVVRLGVGDGDPRNIALGRGHLEIDLGLGMRNFLSIQIVQHIEGGAEPGDREEPSADDVPGGDEPEEGDALDIPEEKRRVTEGGKHAPHVGDDEDEEDHVVRHHLPTQQIDVRAHKEHGCTGRADKVGEDRAESQQADGGFGAGRELEVEEDTTGDAEKRSDEADEGDIVGERDQ
eukprot:m.142167 g.142167  ORF g.142167 m.142167 type:complete len:502 (-) comp9641_c0_seq1:187-1692(-)